MTQSNRFIIHAEHIQNVSCTLAFNMEIAQAIRQHLKLISSKCICRQQSCWLGAKQGKDKNDRDFTIESL